MTWVLADDHDSTVATDDLALVANLLDAWVDLHVSYFLLGALTNPVEQLPVVTVEVCLPEGRHPETGFRKLICSGR
ncbi:MAG: hypothetical protein RL243_535 [Actinomycetota bacterium]